MGNGSACSDATEKAMCQVKSTPPYVDDDDVAYSSSL